MSTTCLILGSTGHIGKVVADHVIRSGHFDLVRLAVRRPEAVVTPVGVAAHRVGVVKCDVYSEEDVRRAFLGITSAFLITPDDFFDDEWDHKIRRAIQYFADGVRAARPTRVICLSNLGAALESPSGDLCVVKVLEQSIQSAADSHTQVISVRAGFFFNIFDLDIMEAAQTGVMTTFFEAKVRFPCVAPRDIGRIVADLLISQRKEREGNFVVNVALRDFFGPLDVINTLAHVLGRPIQLAVIPAAELPQLCASIKIPPCRAQSLLEMRNCMSSHLSCFRLSDGEMEHTTTTLEDYICDFLKNL